MSSPPCGRQKSRGAFPFHSVGRRAGDRELGTLAFHRGQPVRRDRRRRDCPQATSEGRSGGSRTRYRHPRPCRARQLRKRSVHLLLFGRLPTHEELTALNARPGARRSLPNGLLAMMTRSPRDLCRWTCCAPASPPSRTSSAPCRRLARDLDRNRDRPHREGADHRGDVGSHAAPARPIAPDPKLTDRANFLYMRTGEQPIPEARKRSTRT